MWIIKAWRDPNVRSPHSASFSAHPQRMSALRPLFLRPSHSQRNSSDLSKRQEGPLSGPSSICPAALNLNGSFEIFAVEDLLKPMAGLDWDLTLPLEVRCDSHAVVATAEVSCHVAVSLGPKRINVLWLVATTISMRSSTCLVLRTHDIGVCDQPSSSARARDADYSEAREPQLMDWKHDCRTTSLSPPSTSLYGVCTENEAHWRCQQLRERTSTLNAVRKKLNFKGKFGAPDRIRTCGLCLRRAALYPAELRVPIGAE